MVFLAVVTTLAWGLFFENAGDRPLTIAGDRYVTMRLNVDREAPLDPGNTEAQEAHRRLLRSLYERFAERVAAEPGVRGIGFGSRLPGMNHLQTPIELDGTGRVQMVRNVTVSSDLLSTLQARLVGGTHIYSTLMRRRAVTWPSSIARSPARCSAAATR